AARHDGRETCCNSRPADARRREAPARRFCGGHLAELRCGPCAGACGACCGCYNAKTAEVIRRLGNKIAMREIVFDTETTGLDPLKGIRLVGIGCVELVNRFPSGRVFHRYFNPDRDMPAEAFAVHGLSVEFLKDKPRFAEIADELAAFIEDTPLVAHNALF